jgi:hypothetical protein
VQRLRKAPSGEQLLMPLLVRGQTPAPIQLPESRKRLQDELARLPDHICGLQAAPSPYPANFGERLRAERSLIQRQLISAIDPFASPRHL